METQVRIFPVGKHELITWAGQQDRRFALKPPGKIGLMNHQGDRIWRVPVQRNVCVVPAEFRVADLNGGTDRNPGLVSPIQDLSHRFAKLAAKFRGPCGDHGGRTSRAQAQAGGSGGMGLLPGDHLACGRDR